jgi:hypothetical protein
MVDLVDRAIVVEWLAKLALRCAPIKSGAEDTELRIRTFAAPLAADLPAGAFTDASLEAISRKCEFFPGYAQLRKLLDGWWEANKASPLIALSGGIPEGMPAADRSMIIFWREYISGAKPLPTNVSLDTWLSMIRKPTPAAFAFLCNTCTKAASIAVRHNWIRDRRTTPTADEIEAVHDAVLDAKAAMHPTAATMPVQPPRPAAAPTPPAQASPPATDEPRPSPVPAKTLSPEHLAAHRMAAGISIPPSPTPAPAKAGSRPFAARPANDAHPPPPKPAPAPAGGPFPWS